MLYQIFVCRYVFIVSIDYLIVIQGVNAIVCIHKRLKLYAVGIFSVRKLH